MTDKPADKLYYSIGEVSKMLDLPQSVLRYWETEFKQIRPPRNRTGKRLYRQEDIEKITAVKELLYDKRFTIEGAKHALRKGIPDEPAEAGDVTMKLEQVEEMKKELREILALLDGGEG